MSRKGVSPRRWTEEEDVILRRMWKAGQSARAIARELGRPREEHVEYRRKYLGLPARRNAQDGERARVTVSLPPSVKAALDSRSFASGRAVSTHVRLLIQRDLGLT